MVFSWLKFYIILCGIWYLWFCFTVNYLHWMTLMYVLESVLNKFTMGYLFSPNYFTTSAIDSCRKAKLLAGIRSDTNFPLAVDIFDHLSLWRTLVQVTVSWKSNALLSCSLGTNMTLKVTNEVDCFTLHSPTNTRTSFIWIVTLLFLHSTQSAVFCVR